MRVGDAIKVTDYKGDILDRVIVDSDMQNVYVCTFSEFSTAELENREPVSIGFKWRDVVRDEAA